MAMTMAVETTGTSAHPVRPRRATAELRPKCCDDWKHLIGWHSSRLARSVFLVPNNDFFSGSPLAVAGLVVRAPVVGAGGP